MKKYFVFILMILIIACDSESEYSFNEQIIIEAYLFSDQNLDSIRIVKTFNNFSENEPSILTNGLEATIQFDDKEFIYRQSSSNPEYYINYEEDLKIEENKDYQLELNFNGIIVSSSTLGQTKIENFEISDTIIYIDESSFGNFFEQENDLDVTWDNANEEYFMLNIQLVDTTELEYRKIFDNAEEPPYSMLMPPMNFNNFKINTRMINYFGEYRIILFKINDDFIEFFEGINQNSSSLVDVPTNIVNGKGIFTSISSDTLYLRVSEE